MVAPHNLIFVDPLEREAELRQSMDTAIERLAQQLTEGHTAGFTELMQFYSRFWTYSVRNCLLIHLQCPQASRCAGRYLWNRMGYHIEKGQKAIWIWAPILQKRLDPESGEEVKAVTGFRPAPVFDFSQMAERETKPLPSWTMSLADDSVDQFDRCVKRVQAAGIEVVLTRLPHGIEGSASDGRITIDERLDSRNQLFVLLHELTHALWHTLDIAQEDKSRQQQEFEAEAVAFVAAAVMGLDHPSARDYLLNWQATPELLQASLLVIQRMVRQVLSILEIPFDVPHTVEALVA